MADATGLGLKIANWAWDKKDTLIRLAKVNKWFQERVGKDILVVGAGGAGKSTLGRILAGQYDLLLDTPESYRESIEIEKLQARDKHPTRDQKKEGKATAELVILPGQEHRRASTWTDELRELEEGKYRGLILVSAFGYHSLGQSYKLDNLYDEENEDAFLPAYVASKRSAEVAVLKAVAPHLENNRHPMWVLSVVTKADLWWPENIEARRFYREGEYGVEMARLLGRKDPKQFRHEIVYPALTINNFRTHEGELLRKNTEGYDDRMKVRSLRELYETMEALMNWELR